jgi:hypothetical protein
VAARVGHHPDRMVRSAELRLYALAIACGLVAEGGLALAIFGGAPRELALLLFVEAAMLGVVFGSRPAIAGAVVPMVILYVAELVRRQFANEVADESAVALLTALIFVSIVLAFCAGMTGAVRDRYFRG